MTIVVILVFFTLALLGMPLAFALGLASLGGLLAGGIELSVLPQRMMHAVDSFPLMAIPLFMLAGELMNRGGITMRITVPAVFGVRPRSDFMIAFSMAPTMFFSQGVIEIVRESSTTTVAAWEIGISAP